MAKKWPSIGTALAAMSLTIVFVWYGQRPALPKQATWDDVMAEAEAGGYKIISTEELADRYRTEPNRHHYDRYPAGMGVPHRTY